MVCDRESRGRGAAAGWITSADFAPAARSAHRVRAGLHGAQVPRHGADRDGCSRGLPADYRRRGRRHAARGGQRPLHPADGSRPDEVLLAVVAVGTGNDWVRTFGISSRYQDAVKAIAAGVFVPAGRRGGLLRGVALPPEPLHGHVAGVGFDAHVVRKLSHLKKKGHKSRWRYTWCVVKKLLPLQVDGHQGVGRRPAGLQQPAAGRWPWASASSTAEYAAASGGDCRRRNPGPFADPPGALLAPAVPLHYLFNGGIYRIRHILQERGSRIRIESSPGGFVRGRR